MQLAILARHFEGRKQGEVGLNSVGEEHLMARTRRQGVGSVSGRGALHDHVTWRSAASILHGEQMDWVLQSYEALCSSAFKCGISPDPEAGRMCASVDPAGVASTRQLA